LGTNTKFRHQKKNSETFEMSGFARPTFVKGGKFPLCSYKEFRANSKFRVFLKEIAPAGTKKLINF